ncbi:MAG: right-handed parallel beta-helix repeat-containing protein [Akkermansiaceae bacterium]|nr:right-handed parallel beta-helix repeat-containing protein [Akkermansiaceae bacterium]
MANQGDEIWVSGGTCYPDEGTGQTFDDRDSTFNLKDGVSLYGSFLGSETDPTQRIPGEPTTILSGDLLQDDSQGNRSDNSYQVVSASDVVENTTFDRFIIESGQADDPQSTLAGAGMYLRGSSPHILACVFRNHFATFDGAALRLIYNGSGTVSEPLIESCRFEGNTARRGGALFITGLSNQTNKPTFISCVFTDNYSEVSGGAVGTNSTDAKFTDCTFQDNTAVTLGGAITVSGKSPMLTGCRFENNSADGGGGAIYGSQATLIRDQCQFYGNRCLDTGGALYNNFSISVVTNCSFVANTGRNGGAAYNIRSDSSYTNCLFVGNLATFSAGAVYNSNSAAPHFLNCSFAGNGARQTGGAIRNYSSATPPFTNCLFWNNVAASNENSALATAQNAIDAAGIFRSCLVANSGGSSNWNPQIGTDAGGNIDVNPEFLYIRHPLSAPSPWNDLRVRITSPAIDAGITSKGQTEMDLSGAMRVQGTAIDIGAFEGGYPITFATLHPTLDPDYDSNGNGASNFLEYAVGSHPEAPDEGKYILQYKRTDISFQSRAYAEDLIARIETSTDLTDWQELIEVDDYSEKEITYDTTGFGLNTSFKLNPPDISIQKKFYRTSFIRIMPPMVPD